MNKDFIEMEDDGFEFLDEEFTKQDSNSEIDEEEINLMLDEVVGTKENNFTGDIEEVIDLSKVIKEENVLEEKNLLKNDDTVSELDNKCKDSSKKSKTGKTSKMLGLILAILLCLGGLIYLSIKLGYIPSNLVSKLTIKKTALQVEDNYANLNPNEVVVNDIKLYVPISVSDFLEMGFTINNDTSKAVSEGEALRSTFYHNGIIVGNIVACEHGPTVNDMMISQIEIENFSNISVVGYNGIVMQETLPTQDMVELGMDEPITYEITTSNSQNPQLLQDYYLADENYMMLIRLIDDKLDLYAIACN